jgi:dolichyl-phosphate-mannose-protein mannosyltransferase
VNRWRVAFACALLLALVAGHLLRDSPGYMVHNPDGTTTGDITHYVYWTRLVTLGGIQSAYSGTWPETYAVYPPVTLYPFEVIGSAYRWLQDPSFDPQRAQDSLWLHEAIKLVALAWHLLTACALFALIARASTERLAAVAASLYVLNPAAIFDVMHWAQPDGAHAVFSVMSIGLLSLGQVLVPWAAVAAAALAKPQAWSIVPLLALATARSCGVWALARGIVAAGLAGLLITFPFFVTGHGRELLGLPATISSVMPVVSADAHNFWWVLLQPRGEDPLFVQDATRALGPLSYRVVAAGLVGAVMLLTIWLYWTRRAGLAEAAALGVLGWFTFTTQAHENHVFFALPLLSLAWPTRHWLLVPFGVLTLTLFMNMLLHDQLLLESLGRGIHDPDIEQLRLLNAGLNVLCCLGWAVWAALRAPAAIPTSATVTYWPRHPTPVGLEVTSD